nr:uncharacterized protein LOC109166354 [Ipomoea batatas]
MDATYVSWIWHGEEAILNNSIDDNDKLREEEHKFADEDPIDMVNAAYNEYVEDPTKFCKLLEDAEKPLYPGSTAFTKLSALVKLYNLKAKYSWSDTSFTDLLDLFVKMLPIGNELPSSLYEAKRSLVALGMDYEKIHACPNDCILYRKENANCTNCPTCGTSSKPRGGLEVVQSIQEDLDRGGITPTKQHEIICEYEVGDPLLNTIGMIRKPRISCHMVDGSGKIFNGARKNEGRNGIPLSNPSLTFEVSKQAAID